MVVAQSQAGGTIDKWLKVFGSRHLLDWLTAEQVSLAVTTYQFGKLLLLGGSHGVNLPCLSARLHAAWIVRFARCSNTVDELSLAVVAIREHASRWTARSSLRSTHGVCYR